MECFIIENGVERKVELEEILPMYGIGLQYILRDAFGYNYLPYALAYLPDEIKKLVYSNLLLRIRGRLEKEIEDVESKCKKDDSLIRDAREKLISFIGENKRLPYFYSGSVVWKETKPKEPAGPVEKLINDIEKACVSGRLYLSVYDTDKMSKDDVKNTFAAFRDRKDELQKIRTLNIDAEDLPAVSLLFEAGGIDDLSINGKFDGTWPEFLEKYQKLTSIELCVWEGLPECPSWIRNAVSLRCLSFNNKSNITLLPDWIGDMQSLTKLDIRYGNSNLKTLPDSICNLKNLAKLSICGSVLEKLPDSIGDLSSLKELYLSNNKNLTSLPDSIGNLRNLASLSIHNVHNSALEKLPDSIGNLSSLKDLSLIGNDNLTSLPDSIGNLKNLTKISVHSSALEKLPDSIGDLSSLKKLYLDGNYNLTFLPDSICNLRNLTEFYLRCSLIKALPDCIGNLQNLVKLSLEGTKIESLPESIGRLKNLTMLNLCRSCIEKLPDTIADCSSLKCLDIRKTGIKTFPDFISSIEELKKTIEVIPKKRSISYNYFCNYYYTLVETIFRFSGKARREGLLSLEEEMDSVSDGFFPEGIRLVTDGVDWSVIRDLLAFKVERERHYYIKKLKETAMEGILCIQNGDSFSQIGLKLAAMVDIKNNPLDAACAKYLAGDYGAFNDIDFKAAIQPQEEREEVRFIKRACDMLETNRREGIVGIEQRLDNDGIAARDVFEYGLSLVVVGRDYKDIDKNLTMLISHETDPVLKNFSLAKKEAVRMIYEGGFYSTFKPTLLAYFDDDVADECPSEFDEEML